MIHTRKLEPNQIHVFKHPDDDLWNVGVTYEYREGGKVVGVALQGLPNQYSMKWAAIEKGRFLAEVNRCELIIQEDER